MNNHEKTEFMLEQMRLCLRKKDYIRMQIISRKILPRTFEKAEMSDLKIRFHTLMVEFYAHTHQYLDIFKCYQAIYRTDAVQNDASKWKEYLKLSVAFLTLSPYSNEQHDLLNKIALDKNLNLIPAFRELVTTFLNKELIPWKDFLATIKPEFDKLAPFKSDANAIPGVSSTVDRLWADLRDRTTEHNIRVLAAYYSKLSITRLAQLLDQTPEDAEKQLCEQVSSHFIWARVDRSNGIVNFIKPQSSNEVLTDWSSDISALLGHVEKVCHLIQRENMVHVQRKANHGKMDVSK